VRLHVAAVAGQVFIAALLVAGTASLAVAQSSTHIPVSLESRSEGRATPDATGTRLVDEVRRGLAAIDGVEIVPQDGSRRTIWIVAGTTPGAVAASVIVTERYDRETLMVLGIEDDDMAFKMMALQIVADHQIFTGRTVPEVAKRIVAALNDGVFARLRALPPRP
jgi:hypothetical protein